MSPSMRHRPDDILEAACSLFFAEGVHVTTGRIAAAAGVSNGTLFNYFPTKQSLIDALYVSIKTDVAEAAGDLSDTDPIEVRFRLLWDRLFRWARDHREAHTVVNLLHQSNLASAEAQAAGLVAIAEPVRVLDDAKEPGVLVDLPIEYLCGLMQHHLDQAVASGLDDRQADIAFRVLWNGITQHT